MRVLWELKGKDMRDGEGKAWGLVTRTWELVLDVGGLGAGSALLWILNMFACHLYSALVRKVERKGELESGNLAAPLRDCHYFSESQFSHRQMGPTYSLGVVVRYRGTICVKSTYWEPCLCDICSDTPKKRIC